MFIPLAYILPCISYVSFQIEMSGRKQDNIWKHFERRKKVYPNF